MLFSKGGGLLTRGLTLYGKDEIMELYKYASNGLFSFLFVRLDAKTRKNMFWLRSVKRLLPKEAEDGDVVRSGPMGGSVSQARYFNI